MYQKPKGTYDVTPLESQLWRHLETKIHQLMHTYQYTYVRTPIFESYDVFHRHNEHSDMVTKETYDFKDRSDRLLTLRPEGTAGVIRSVIEHKMIQPGVVLKLYYLGPNYRYERPQKGRFREFYQFGVEVIGDAHPSLDVDVMMTAYDLIKMLDIKNVTIALNYLGDSDTRKRYVNVLKDYLLPFEESLSHESKQRLHNNPLRILDSKQKEDQMIVKEAPNIIDVLSHEERAYFDAVIMLLKESQIPYKIDHRLVRGLDYYAHCVFEIQAESDELGAQNALGGGGRYDQLIREMGGPGVSGIGFAFGMERLLLAMPQKDVAQKVDIAIITQHADVYTYAYPILQLLRTQPFNVHYDFSYKSMKAQLKYASSLDAQYALIIGTDELEKQTITVKNLKAFSQETIPLDDLVSYLKTHLGV